MKKSDRRITVTFWGTRGSVPTPGASTLRFGGNTSCVTVESGIATLILDGGTGLRVLGVAKRRPFKGKTITILVSHAHLDHVGGIPFFKPALERNRVLKIMGPPGLKQSLGDLFPFPILPAKKQVREIRPGDFHIRPFQISSCWVNHPGGSLGYRLRTPFGKTLVYISDHEPTTRYRHGRKSPSDRFLLRWMEGADLLIMDAQYFDGESRQKKGWGHSPVSYTVRMALKARVRRLVLFHHDPAHSDLLLQRKLALAKKMIQRKKRPLLCSLAREGEKITL